MSPADQTLYRRSKSQVPAQLPQCGEAKWHEKVAKPRASADHAQNDPIVAQERAVGTGGKTCKTVQSSWVKNRASFWGYKINWVSNCQKETATQQPTNQTKPKHSGPVLELTRLAITRLRRRRRPAISLNVPSVKYERVKTNRSLQHGHAIIQRQEVETKSHQAIRQQSFVPRIRQKPQPVQSESNRTQRQQQSEPDWRDWTGWDLGFRRE